MTAMVVACEHVGVSVVVVSERDSGNQQVFHDEALGLSWFFGTMCNCGGCTNVAASWPGRRSSQPSLSIHTNVNMRNFRAGCHERAKVFQVLLSFPSQQMSNAQCLPLTLKMSLTMQGVTSTTTVPDMETLRTPGDLLPFLSPIHQLMMRILACKTLTSADLFRSHPGNY